MRFFLFRNNLSVVSKNAFSGDEEVINNLVLKQAGILKVEEVDEKVFDATSIENMPSKDQKDWSLAKSKGSDEAFSFIAQKLGFE